MNRSIREATYPNLLEKNHPEAQQRRFFSIVYLAIFLAVSIKIYA